MSNNTVLTEWLLSKPYWLQKGAKLILTQGSLLDSDIALLADLCINKKTDQDLTFSELNQFHENDDEIRINKISEVISVNALSSQTTLEFGDKNVSVIYGRNGSGKSGYVRLLKSICGARNIENLHPNIFNEISGNQQAKIEVTQNGSENSFLWQGNSIDELIGVDIFDTSFGAFFIDSSKEVGYEPPILSFLSELISISERVGDVIEHKISTFPEKKPQLPSHLSIKNELISWFSSINVKTPISDIDKYCQYAEADKIQLQNVEERLKETSPKEKANKLMAQKKHIDEIVTKSMQYTEALSNATCSQIFELSNKLTVKKKAADTVAKQLFSESKLEGIGSDVWSSLWESARNYSNQLAYKEADFPFIEDNSLCVLCHQPLNDSAKKRLQTFEEFMKNEANNAVDNVSKQLQLKISQLPNLPTNDIIKTKLTAGGYDNKEHTQKLIDAFEALRKRKSELENNECLEVEKMSEIIDIKICLDDFKKYSQQLGEKAQNFLKDTQGTNKSDLLSKKNNLLAKKWLFENRSSIKEEITRLGKVENLKTAKKATNTKGISDKKSELAEELITQAFVDRFNLELKNFGASKVQVELVKDKVSKGKVLHKLKLKKSNHKKITEILSEGERRIISIAAFLADITGKSNKATIIFDDPISSLDQDFEEAVVKRLIELSEYQQIIIFTHRLSLLGTVKSLLSAQSDKNKYHVISIRSSGNVKGVLAPLPLSQGEIAQSLNKLLNDRLPQVGKNGDLENDEMIIKSVCSDFRIILERSIEEDLLCGVIQRFQRPVHSLKIKNLPKLTRTDCDFIDELMTKYSYFEHSQPIETPVELPEVEELKRDIETLRDWRYEYRKR